jgi:hypothetical protein
MTLKRVRPFKQGRAGRLHKIMSTVKLELGNRGTSTKAKKATVPALVETKSVDADAASKAAKKVAKPRAKKATTK